MKRFIGFIFLLGFAGCASHGDLHSQSTPLAIKAAAAAIDEAWWKQFGDPQLDYLIDQALSSNPDIRIAAARVRQAEAIVKFTQADSSPQLSASGSAAREKISKNGMIPPPFAGATVTAAQLALDFSYDFDFWDRNRNAALAAVSEAEAARAETSGARLVLSSAIAQCYFSLERLTGQLSLARQAQQIRSEILARYRAREKSGIESDLKVRQAERELARQSLAVSLIEEQIKQSRNQLALLLGKNALEPISLGPIRLVDPENPKRLAADMLGLRPDILAQRLQLEAASRRVEVAKAEFYPNINLAGLLGFQSIGIGQLLKNGSVMAQVGPAFNLPIYGGGRLRANLKARYADYDILVERYNQSVLRAMREVADASATLDAVGRELAEQTAAVEAAGAAYRIESARARAGIDDQLIALEAKAPFLDERSRQIELIEKRRQGLVMLYRAAGGHTANQVHHGN